MRYSIILSLVIVTYLFSFLYEVGPGKPYENIGDVPLETLKPGDTVKIYYRTEPYYEKWCIGTAGKADSPIVFLGVPDLSGNLPIIDGENAVTRLELNYWSEERGIINIGGSNLPGGPPNYIIIENLEIRKARPPYNFYDDAGNLKTYADNASSIYAVEGSNIIIRNCVFTDCANGFFASHAIENIIIEACYIYNNGVPGSPYQHNSYTETQGIIYQFNHFGPLKENAYGNNLKDRSSGCIIRYNWIEYGNRQLDLVDAGHPEIYEDSSYRKTFVYGNILIEQYDEGNSQIIHYGGDSGDTTKYRHGTLYLYNNTIISKREGNTTVLRLSTNLESCDSRNNILYTTADGSRLALLEVYGNLIIRNNWIKSGWVISHSGFQGTFVDSGGIIEGTSPGFLDFNDEDFHLNDSSPCINAGTFLPNAVLPENNVIYQYVKHRSYENRPNDGIFDIGAFEHSLYFIKERRKLHNSNLSTIFNRKSIYLLNLPQNAWLNIYDPVGRRIVKIFIPKRENKIFFKPSREKVYFYIINSKEHYIKGKIIILK
jgi:hypothetical protein